MELFKNETIRALSWNNPFAVAMIKGKDETRGRATKVRGLVLICSCKKSYAEGYVAHLTGQDQFYRLYSAIAGKERLNGYAIAIGELVDCYPMKPEHEDKCFVQYREGLWVWKFQNVQEIEPFPFKGKQGWSIIDDETKAKIKKS